MNSWPPFRGWGLFSRSWRHLALWAFCVVRVVRYPGCVSPERKYLRLYFANSGLQGTDETELVKYGFGYFRRNAAWCLLEKKIYILFRQLVHYLLCSKRLESTFFVFWLSYYSCSKHRSLLYNSPLCDSLLSGCREWMLHNLMKQFRRKRQTTNTCIARGEQSI